MKAAAAFTAALMLCGCSLAPKYERGAAPVMASWPTGASYGADYASLPSADYRTLFADERLQALITQALDNNRDLRRATANIARARAQFRMQRADFLPVIDAGADVGRSAIGGVPATSNASADLSITSYELDLFGRIHSLTDAARSTYFATQADEQALRLSLIGDIADAWLLHGADSSLLVLGQATVEAAQRSVDLTQARLSGGVAPRTDLRQAQTILAIAQSDVARSTTALAQDRNRIELLVGAPIDPALLPSTIAQASERIGEPSVAMSSEVLLRRPDIMAAEHDLRAANAQIGAARAALFPRITLGALIGLVGPSLEGLLGGRGTQRQQGQAAASYSIFQGGADKANVAASEAQRDALLATYEKAIQSAYRETADALARRGTISAQLAADRLRVEASEDAYMLANARYRGGVDNFLQALDAQRSQYAAQRNLVGTQLEAVRNRVSLYRALGGETAEVEQQAEPDAP